MSGNGTLTADLEEIGSAGKGTFIEGAYNQAGGQNWSAPSHMGKFAGSEGIYELSSGSLTTLGNASIGIFGSGQFTNYGGSHTVNGNLALGIESGGRGTYELYGALTVDGNITTGAGYSMISLHGGSLLVGGGNGSIDVSELEFWSPYSLSGGSLKAGKSLICSDGFPPGWRDPYRTGTLDIGYQGTCNSASYTQTAGTNTVGTLALGGNSPQGYDTRGLYVLTGGQLQADVETISGQDQYGLGSSSFTQTGGTNTVTGTLTIGKTFPAGRPRSYGSYTLNGGTLSAGNVQVLDGSFDFQAGTLNLTSANLIWVTAAWSARTSPWGRRRNLGVTNGDQVLGPASLTLAGGQLEAGTLVNEGKLGFTASSNLTSQVTNLNQILISGGATGTFAGDVIHNGTEIRVGRWQHGDLPGQGDRWPRLLRHRPGPFAGRLHARQQPGSGELRGRCRVDPGNTLFMELGGLLRGTEYDALDITGTATLGGLLDVTLWNNFTPEAGAVFDLDRGQLDSREFSALSLPEVQGLAMGPPGAVQPEWQRHPAPDGRHDGRADTRPGLDARPGLRAAAAPGASQASGGHQRLGSPADPGHLHQAGNAK